MIDLTRLEKLLNGNEKMVNRFIGIFKNQTPEQLNTLITAVAQDDWSQVSITAHAIKSQCKYLGLDEMAELAHKIELSAENHKELNLIPGLATTLQTKINKVLAHLLV